MKPLDRKLMRDASRMRTQLAAIALVVACGIASYVAMLGVHSSLRRQAAEYFEGHRLPDVFASLQRAPLSVARRIASKPEVELLEARIVKPVTLDVPGLAEPANGRIVSLPDDGEPILSRIHLRKGRWPQVSRADEVMISEAFALKNALQPGDTLGAVLSGRMRRLQIVGIALSPEYVYQIPPGSLFPDDRRFGVLWMRRTPLAAAFDMEGAFDDLALTLAPGASQEAMEREIDTTLAPWGAHSVYGRDEQVSYRFVNEELEQLESTGGFMPIIFLGVAAFLLNIVMSRLVAGQRTQIAALKALGYSNRSVGWHYGKLAIGVVGAGSVVGVGLGALLGEGLIGMYSPYFRFPVLQYQLDPTVVVTGIALAVVGAVAGTYQAVSSAVRLPPAEAMRPPAPPRYRPGILDRTGLSRLLPASGRIVLRNLTRRKWRTALSTLGIALATSIMVAGNFGVDAMDYVMTVNFETVQRQDVTVIFDRPLDRRAVEELEHLPGVLYAEPSRDLPVRFHAAHRSYDTAVMGLPRTSHLHRLLDAELQPMELPPGGVLMTRALGERLEVRIGEEIVVERLEGRRRRYTVAVAGFVDEMIGMQAYMDLEALGTMLGEPGRVSGARMLLDPARVDETYLAIEHLPHVAGANLREAVYDIFDETFAEMQAISATILIAFASVIAVGVVYNGARAVVAERSRELASLRVLGFTRAEVSWILLGELFAQLVMAIPLGFVLGYGLASAAVATLDAELYRFPVVISPRTYLTAGVVVGVAGVITSLVVRRRLDRLDLVEVLKSRE